MTTATSEKIELICDKEHKYWRLRRNVLGITEVLTDNGFIDPTYYRPIHSYRGFLVHAFSQYIDEGEDIAGTLKIASTYTGYQGEPFFPDRPAKGLDGYVLSYVKTKTALHLEPLVREEMFYSTQFDYAGKPDGLYRDNGWELVGEIKTGPYQKAAAYQTAAQDQLFTEALGRPAKGMRRRASFHLDPDGGLAVIKRHDDDADFAHFLCALDVSQQRRLHHGHASRS